MEEIISMLESSLEDRALTGAERKKIKASIKAQKFTRNDFDFLRSKIFDLAKSHQSDMSKENIIDWIESANKMTLGSSDTTHSKAKVFFSPGTQCRDAILSQIRRAVSNLKICVFTISDNFISDEIISAHKRGVDVKIITDNKKSEDRGSDILALESYGIPVVMDHTRNHMHHKFCIADGRTLLTGSYNWTRSAAEFNQENVLVTTDQNVVKRSMGEFERLWQELGETP